MESIAKTLINHNVVYYLIKGLIYLVLWQATYKFRSAPLAEKQKRKKEKDLEEISGRVTRMVIDKEGSFGNGFFILIRHCMVCTIFFVFMIWRQTVKF